MRKHVVARDSQHRIVVGFAPSQGGKPDRIYRVLIPLAWLDDEILRLSGRKWCFCRFCGEFMYEAVMEKSHIKWHVKNGDLAYVYDEKGRLIQDTIRVMDHSRWCLMEAQAHETGITQCFKIQKKEEPVLLYLSDNAPTWTQRAAMIMVKTKELDVKVLCEHWWNLSLASGRPLPWWLLQQIWYQE